MNCAVYTDGRRIADVDIRDIHDALRQQEGFIWIGLHEPEEEILREVQQQFALHDLAIEDAHLAHQRPKLERYGESLFIVLRTAQMNTEQHHIDFGETHLFVGPRYVVSVRHGSSLSYRDLRTSCERSPELLRKGPAFVLYALMDFIVDQYFPVIDALEDELQQLEERIFSETFSRDISRRIYELRREVLEVKRAVSPLVDISNRLMRIETALIPEDTRPYFRDVYDHVIRINDMLDTVRDLLTAALEANLSLTAVGQNDAMKRLTAWAAIVAVPTMVGGIYGMNFRFMPELEWPLGYPLVMGLTIAVCGFLFTRFKRTGWL